MDFLVEVERTWDALCKGIIIKILDFELGPFSETSRLIMTWEKRILDYLFREKSFSLAEN